jgi:hypothetical protein
MPLRSGSLGTLLLLARFGKEGGSENMIPKISQETLAEMAGTARARINFFMNRFRRLALIDYNGGLEVHSSLSTSCYTSNVSLQEESGRRMCTIGQFLDS